MVGGRGCGVELDGPSVQLWVWVKGWQSRHRGCLSVLGRSVSLAWLFVESLHDEFVFASRIYRKQSW